MDDATLEKRAIDEIYRDLAKSAASPSSSIRHSSRTNKRFLGQTIKAAITHNKRVSTRERFNSNQKLKELIESNTSTHSVRDSTRRKLLPSEDTKADHKYSNSRNTKEEKSFYRERQYHPAEQANYPTINSMDIINSFYQNYLLQKISKKTHKRKKKKSRKSKKKNKILTIDLTNKKSKKKKTKKRRKSPSTSSSSSGSDSEEERVRKHNYKKRKRKRKVSTSSSTSTTSSSSSSSRVIDLTDI